MDKKIHQIVTYVLLVLVMGCIALLAHRSLRETSPQGEWRCTSYMCSKTVNPSEWTTENCYVDGLTGATYCTLVIDGAKQVVPLEVLNLTYLGEQCETYVCTEETYIRKVNYTLSVNTSSVQIQS